MSRPPKRPNSGDEKTQNDDQEIWDAWAKTVTPTTAGKPRVRLAGPNEIPSQQASARESAPTSNPEKHARKSAQNPVDPSPGRPRVVPELAQFDHKSRRRLAGGRNQIDARIDLHGMRQMEAHSALTGFLRASQARGFRWVLVITGKGGQTSARDYDDAADGYDHSADNRRGVLRRAVPQWLAEPQCRAMVVSHTSAAPHHGGEGAIYVQLRARR